MAGVEHDPSAVLLKLPREQSRWLSGLARQARGALGLAVAAPLLAGALLVFQAWLLASVLDKAIVQGAGREALLPGIAAIAALIVVRAILTWVGERAGIRAAERIKVLVRQSLFADMLSRGPQWTRGQASGSLASVMVEQVEAFDGFFSRYLPTMVSGTFLPVAFAIVVLPVDYVAGLLLLLTAPLIPVFMALVGWGAEAASRRHLEAFARLSGFFADRLRGLSTLKLYGRARAEAEAVQEASETLRGKTMSVLRIAFLSSATLEFFAALGVAGVALYVGLTYLGFVTIRSDILTLQAGMFCLLMAPEVYNPLRQFAAHYHDRAAARAAVAEIAAIYENLPAVSADSAATPEAGQGGVPDPASGQPAQGAAGLIMRQLEVRAPGREAPLLQGCDLSVAPGERIALMGDSGIGKSSLLETLAGLRPAAAGDILLDGQMLAQWQPAALRRRIALIGQHPYLHQDSIAGNLRLAAPQASHSELLAAAAQAGMDDFLAELPQGLDTRLGQRGYGLSGGQAQRVALARLFLRDPGLILLDEPTAHLDGVTRDRVMDAILAFARGRTLLVATHDIDVARRLDRIWRFGTDGRLQEVSPEALASLQGEMTESLEVRS
ncbi:thiol reductant ABC exporter subunit CydD [Kerstersia gyiorum]|uniref:thiol reductant ABC exporter subunit CydD n=1 Tax=Kerstersia gyiorum TaxID=206506 RepID=UPI0020A1568B|nr:thiol reductant ABC exporter subunit CydD [Kerstersia gyiorum]MCP1677992.1 ATP-binding cassette subfamily C protein CydD [Kerstersia gyiorum]MCP1711065.1 ATP-binding cassette subfamily C protein CydD [Kerstersia gyiorum]MCP1822117.1 ATP-binding cassette subfamily C protein CydD [Kerstersia gyiorum]MCP1825541.1 ATP-binding cassette subfamily C protein CydD [Kerstersia gyiorum]MCW2449417.1 ATP-binding cassette subfamily C protein CydD [Kerstersia gyiorum]